jgi:ABC-type cobalt transport system substrate-binding protein
MIVDIIIVLACVVAVFASIFAFRFALIIVRMEEELELALDKLDASYKAVGKILERPLFFDSAEVRSVLFELRKAQSAILQAAVGMSMTLNQTTENEEEDPNL